MLIRRIEAHDSGASTIAARDLSIWAILESRIGDNKQVLALAGALRGSVRIIQLRDTIPQVIAGRALDSFGFHAPWHKRKYAPDTFPDLMIAAGGRSVTLARWVKRASNGRTKIVVLGRPWARLEDFDLVVTTPQYCLPRARNIQMNLLPLNHAEAYRLDEARARWMASFAHLPRPWIGALIGGDSGSFRMTRQTAGCLGKQLSRQARQTGGSVIMATSARTAAEHGEAIAASLKCPSYVHLWHAPQGENPYLGILALADRFVVTSESASMIAEAANTSRPVQLFELPERFTSRILTHWTPALGLGWLFRLGARSGYWTPPRDMRRLHRVLEARGYIGGDGPAANRPRPIELDLARTVARIDQLFERKPLAGVRPTVRPGTLATQPI